jgi:hypothetical protein
MSYTGLTMHHLIVYSVPIHFSSQIHVLFVRYKFPNGYFIHGALALRELQGNYGEVLEIPNRFSSSAKIKEKEKGKKSFVPDLNQWPQDGRQILHSCVLPTV